MYNLLIVDDEPLITDSLYDLFAGAAEPELNVLKAYSGGEALGWSQKSRVDILLTDISMPDMNGMDVHRRVRELWPDCLAIFLTSFDEFSYVRQAMRGGGEDYILKTEGDGPVLGAVASAARRLDALRRDRLLIERAKNDLTLALPILQAEFLAGLADSDALPPDLHSKLSELQIPLDGDAPVLPVIGRVDCWPKDAAPAERLKLIYRAKSAMETYFAESAAAVCAVYGNNMLVELLQAAPRAGGPGRQEPLALRVRGSLDGLQSMCRESYGLPMSFAASGGPVEWAEAGAAFRALRQKLRLEAGPAGEMLLYSGAAGGVEPAEAAADTAKLMNMAGELGALLEGFDRDGFLALFDEITGMALHSAASLRRDVCLEVYFRLAALFISHRNSALSGSGHEEAPILEMMAGMKNNAPWAETFAGFRAIAESVFERRAGDRRRNEHRILAFIDEYARKHIGEDLSLTKFATLLNFHPFYLSRLFKQISGKSLSDFVSGIKLEKAREMLGKSTLKISDVSAALGFKTSSYFIFFFRKFTGISPLEYRNGVAAGPDR